MRATVIAVSGLLTGFEGLDLFGLPLDDSKDQLTGLSPPLSTALNPRGSVAADPSRDGLMALLDFPATNHRGRHPGASPWAEQDMLSQAIPDMARAVISGASPAPGD